MNDPMEVEDGKYTFFTDDSGLLDCLRHGEPWPAFREVGGHFAGSTLALYHALVKARAEVLLLRESAFTAKVEWNRTIGRLDSAANSAENAASVIRDAQGRAQDERADFDAAMAERAASSE